MKLLDKLGVLALATRLSLTSEELYNEVRNIYRAQNIDFDPNNFLLFKALLEGEDNSVSFLAKSTGYTQARASQKLAELTNQNLVEKIICTDSRKSCFQLSNKGKNLVKQVEPIWSAIEEILRKDFDSENLLAQLANFEKLNTPGKLSSLSLQLVANKSNKKNSINETLSFQITKPDFDTKIISDFNRLNREWLKEYNLPIEPYDKEIFSDLSKYAYEKNAFLIYVNKGNKTIGTALISKKTDHDFLLSKFCIETNERRQGIARRLLMFCESECLMQGAKTLSLETSSKLKSAIKLYQSAGYKMKSTKSSYSINIDLFMRKKLTR